MHILTYELTCCSHLFVKSKTKIEHSTLLGAPYKYSVLSKLLLLRKF